LAITAILLSATPERLLYQLTRDAVADGNNALTIPNDGGATPDLLTDALTGLADSSGPGPLLAIIRARLDGYGPIAAGALTQAQARALLASDDAGRAVLVSRLIGRCIMRITPRGATAAADMNGYWNVDANVDGQGDPVVAIAGPSDGASAQLAILEIRFRHSEARL
jgi:hypothetical protein